MSAKKEGTMDICHECHGRLKHPMAYHSFLFCELVKLGHHDPAAYLASYGFTRPPSIQEPSPR